MGGCVMRLSNFIYGVDIEAIKSLKASVCYEDVSLEVPSFWISFQHHDDYFKVCLYLDGEDAESSLMAEFFISAEHITHDRLWDRIKENL